MHTRVHHPRKMAFWRKVNVFASQYPSLYRPIHMTYLHKSMQITPLEHCFWLKKSCKMGTKPASKTVTLWPSTTFKTRSYLAYLRRGVRSLTNKPSMKRLGVKKNHSQVSAWFSSWQQIFSFDFIVHPVYVSGFFSTFARHIFINDSN